MHRRVKSSRSYATPGEVLIVISRFCLMDLSNDVKMFVYHSRGSERETNLFIRIPNRTPKREPAVRSSDERYLTTTEFLTIHEFRFP